jgi:hypothetical protein
VSRRPVGLEENDNSDSEALMCRIDRGGVPRFERPCEDLSSEISDRCLKAECGRRSFAFWEPAGKPLKSSGIPRLRWL